MPKNILKKMENLNNINITIVNKSFSKHHRVETRTVTRTKRKTIIRRIEEEYYETEKQTYILTYLTFDIYKKEVKFPKTRQKEINEEIQYEVEESDTIYVFDVSKTRTE